MRGGHLWSVVTPGLDTLLIALCVEIDDHVIGSGRHRAGQPKRLSDAELVCLAVAQVLVSVADCGSATVLVALVAEDLGAGPAAVAGCISFRRLDVARRPLPETPFRPRGSGTSRVPRESVSRCRCPTGRSERMRCHPERVLADRE